MRIFHYKKGKDISDVFLGDGSFCVSIESFFNEKPSDRLIEILEPAEIYLLPRKDLIELCDKYLEFDLFAQSMIAFVVGVLQRKATCLFGSSGFLFGRDTWDFEPCAWSYGSSQRVTTHKPKHPKRAEQHEICPLLVLIFL